MIAARKLGSIATPVNRAGQTVLGWAMAPPIRIRIHRLDHARAALIAARAVGAEVILVSPAGAAGWHGIGWWRCLERRIAEEFGAVTTVLDCADAPGHALAALRAGCRAVGIVAPKPTLARLDAIAQSLGGRLDSAPPALDLLEAGDPLAACRSILEG